MEDLFFDQYIIESAHNQIKNEQLLTKQKEISILRSIAEEVQSLCKSMENHPSLEKVKELLRKAGY
jgi:hypothetical protein